MNFESSYAWEIATRFFTNEKKNQSQPSTRDFSRALRKLQVVDMDFDRFITVFSCCNWSDWY